MDGLTDTFDLVPIGAFMGMGKRTGTYGAYLLASYDPDNEEFQVRLGGQRWWQFYGGDLITVMVVMAVIVVLWWWAATVMVAAAVGSWRLGGGVGAEMQISSLRGGGGSWSWWRQRMVNSGV